MLVNEAADYEYLEGWTFKYAAYSAAYISNEQSKLYLNFEATKLCKSKNYY